MSGSADRPRPPAGVQRLTSKDEAAALPNRLHSRDRAPATVWEELTVPGLTLDRARRWTGRGTHPLRNGAAGSRYHIRGDGGTCWRVAHQQDTAAARRYRP